MKLTKAFMAKAAVAVGAVGAAAVAIMAPATALAQAANAQPAVSNISASVQVQKGGISQIGFSPKMDWTKITHDSPDQWNVRHAQKDYPGDIPPDWNTPKYPPFLNPDGTTVGGLDQPGITITWN